MAHFLLHVVIPAIDTIIGKDARNPTDEEIKLLEKRSILFAFGKSFIPLQYAANIYACYLTSLKDTSFIDKILCRYFHGCRLMVLRLIQPMN